MNIILLGAPGAGKGTQAEMISSHFKIPTISTGNIIREALKSGSEIGIKAKSYIDAGNLVPDEVVIGIVDDRISRDDCKNGFILDGFPRTLVQAEALDNSGIKIDKIIDIEVDDEIIYKRMTGRRVCDNCGRSYNIDLEDAKPKIDGKCDSCSGTLVQRMDDKLEIVKQRLKVYHDQTYVLKSYYENQNKLFVVDGVRPLDEINKDINKILEA